jgi:hypothetical protein
MNDFAMERELSRSLNELTQVNGIEAANLAVSKCDPDSTIIFLTRSEYQDLLSRSVLSELKRYKRKAIIVVSDPLPE